jgi:hypothetical protein
VIDGLVWLSGRSVGGLVSVVGLVQWLIGVVVDCMVCLVYRLIDRFVCWLGGR